MTMRNGVFIMICVWLMTGVANGQIHSSFVEQVLEKELSRKTVGAKYPGQVKEFYQSYGYKTAWIIDETARRELLQQIENASAIGLHKEDYQHDFIASFLKAQLSLVTAVDSLVADFRFTDAAIHFFMMPHLEVNLHPLDTMD